MHAILSLLLDVLLRVFGSFLFWIAIFPVLVVLATPFILVNALTDVAPYFAAVRDRYRGLFEWWRDLAPTIWLD